MDLKHLQYFVAVAEELHFGRAAQRLHMAPQPLSLHVKKLEDELGVRLLNRTTRRVELTPAGQIFFEKALQALNASAEAMEAAKQAVRGERGVLTIGYVTTTLYNVMPALISTFRNQFPHIGLALKELRASDVQAQVAAGKLDLGLVGTPVNHVDLMFVVLQSEPVMVAIPEHHVLSQRLEIPLGLLAGEPFIQYAASENQHNHRTIAALFENASIPLNIVQEAATEQAVIGLVAAKLGVALVSASLSGLRPADVIYRRLIEPSLNIDIRLVWHNQIVSPVARSFIEFAKEKYSE